MASSILPSATSPFMEIHNSEPTIFFKDGIRKIDLVIVFPDDKKNHECYHSKATESQNLIPKGAHKTSNGAKKQEMEVLRQKFIQALIDEGIEVEEEFCGEGDDLWHFVKLHATLCLLQKNANNTIQDERIISTATNENNVCTFSSAHRSRIVYEILQYPFGPRNNEYAWTSISTLIRDGVFAAVYPLNEGPYDVGNEAPKKENQVDALTPSKSIQGNNERSKLYNGWAKYSNLFRYQPLQDIRHYFGEQFAFYFAWLGVYTSWLIVAALMGAIVFIYGTATVSKDPVIDMVCKNPNNITICPICDFCPTTKLSDTCSARKLGYLFDNDATVWYAVFMSIWAVLFLEFWKRKSKRMAKDWNYNGVEEQNNNSKQGKINRPVRMVISKGVILTMAISAVILLVAVMVSGKVVETLIFKYDVNIGFIETSFFAELTRAFLEMFCIVCLRRLCKPIVFIITKWENHRTKSDFENELAFRHFIFQFISHNVSLFYIAFVRGNFVGGPGNYNRFFFGMRNDTCSVEGCQFDIMIRLFVISVEGQLIRQLLELGWPRISNYFRKRHLHLNTLGNSCMEQDFKLTENRGLLDEYMKLMIQFGLVTIFVSSFSLLPLIALFYNLIEIRLDAKRFVCNTRRPIARREKDIGIWYSMLSALGKVAVITNSFLIAFSSDFIERTYYNWNKVSIGEDYTLWTLSLSPKDYTGEPCYYNRFKDMNFMQMEI